MRCLRPILLLLAFVCASSLAPAQTHDPLARFQSFLKRVQEGRNAADPELFHELKLLVSDLRLLWAVDSTRSREIANALLDLSGLTLANWDPQGSEDPTGAEALLREQCADALRAHQDAEFERYLTRDIMLLPHSVPLYRRRAAIWLIAPKPNPGVLLALLTSVRDEDPKIREIALDAVCGYQDPGVHGFFLSLLLHPEEARDLPRAGELVEKHFARVHLESSSPISERLREIVVANLRNEDWRSASRAIALSRPLEHALVVPALIDALETWKRRATAGLQALRIEREIERALATRAEQTYGFEPQRWREWWAAVEKGAIVPRGTAGIEEGTRASFFTLHPWTDRVTFVLDRSGSMFEPFGAPGPGGIQLSRWDEAVNQVLAFMTELGPKARFNIVVFHDFAESWKERLVPADEESRKEARHWLEQKPRGGTMLRAGVERALGLRAEGGFDLSKLESDTVIVLCDGATREGPGWVKGFQSRVNAFTRIVFHGVQIGSQGDGTLERLAQASGGEFVKIDG